MFQQNGYQLRNELVSHRLIQVLPLQQAVITLPVYLNANRKDVLFSAEFRLAQGQSRAAIVEKGVAVVANA